MSHKDNAISAVMKLHEEFIEATRERDALKLKLADILCRCGPRTEIYPSIHTTSCEYGEYIRSLEKKPPMLPPHSCSIPGCQEVP